jgi:hypothetical protein
MVSGVSPRGVAARMSDPYLTSRSTQASSLNAAIINGV